MNFELSEGSEIIKFAVFTGKKQKKKRDIWRNYEDENMFGDLLVDYKL